MGVMSEVLKSAVAVVCMGELAMIGANTNKVVPKAREVRSFVLRGLPVLRDPQEILWIDQGYLPFEMSDPDLEWAAGGRIRRLLRRSGQCDCDLTQHRGTDRIAIDEVSPIHEMVFSRLWQDTQGLTLRKTRYVVEGDGVVWFVESVAELGLFIARLRGQQPSVKQGAIPNWLNAVLLREVTEEPGYRSIDFAYRLRRWRQAHIGRSAG